MSYQILLIDDHAMFRRGLATCLATESDIEVVEAVGKQDGLALIKEHRPDLVLLDIELRGSEQNGLALCYLIRRKFRSVRVVIVSAHDEGRYRQAAIDMGASAFVSKMLDIEDIVAAIRDALSRPAARAVRDVVLGYVPLSIRELSIVNQLSTGASNKLIAKNLKLSERTVSTHVLNIAQKYKVSGRAAIVAEAFRRGDILREEDDGGHV